MRAVARAASAAVERGFQVAILVRHERSDPLDFGAAHLVAGLGRPAARPARAPASPAGAGARSAISSARPVVASASKPALAHDLGVAHRLAGGILGASPVAELAVDEPEVVVRLRRAAPVAEPLVGQERAAVEAQRLVRPAPQVDGGREVVARPRRDEAVAQLGRQVERLRQRLLGLVQAARARTG